MPQILHCLLACGPGADQTADALCQFYAANLRGSLFSGFLTLTGFLFAIKTFIVLNMKKEVYETAEYHVRVAEMRQVNPTLRIYGPLTRLSDFLFWSIVFSLVASVSQLTIGLIPAKWAVVVCLSAAVVAIGLLLASLLLIRMNLNSLFEILEDRGLRNTK